MTSPDPTGPRPPDTPPPAAAPSTGTWSQPALEAWDAALAAQLERARTITADLSPEKLVEPPGPGRWSVAQCFDHLATTSEKYLPYLEGAIAKREARNDAEFPAYRAGPFARWFIAMAGPGKRSIPAPKMFRPAEEASVEAPERFAGEVEALRALLRRADAVNVNATKFRSPASPLLRFRIGEGFDLLVQHGERHLRQAERTRGEVLGG